MKDMKEIRDKPNEKFDMDLATNSEKTRCIELYGKSLTDERKGTAIGEGCGRLGWI